MHVAQNSGNNEWYTPARFIDGARRVMGSIDTDPATSEIANRTVGASTWFTEEHDGRAQIWRGNVWMNPPYAQPLIADFCEALAEKAESGEIGQACVFVNNATETAWFQRLASVASAVFFLAHVFDFSIRRGCLGAGQGRLWFTLGIGGESLSKSFLAKDRSRASGCREWLSAVRSGIDLLRRKSVISADCDTGRSRLQTSMPRWSSEGVSSSLSEGKRTGAPMPFGQRLMLERLTDAVHLPARSRLHYRHRRPRGRGRR